MDRNELLARVVDRLCDYLHGAVLFLFAPIFGIKARRLVSGRLFSAAQFKPRLAELDHVARSNHVRREEICVPAGWQVIIRRVAARYEAYADSAVEIQRDAGHRVRS